MNIVNSRHGLHITTTQAIWQSSYLHTCKYCCWSDDCGLQPPLLSTTPCRPLACGACRRATCGWLVDPSDDDAVIAESGMALLCTPSSSRQPRNETLTKEKQACFDKWKFGDIYYYTTINPSNVTVNLSLSDIKI